jgi:hypothetical protein
MDVNPLTGIWSFTDSQDTQKKTSIPNFGKIVAADKSTLARIADETRPKNIKVVYLMKCWHL